MDLIFRLRAWALARPRVLVVEEPGSEELRWRAEAELDRRALKVTRRPGDAKPDEEGS